MKIGDTWVDTAHPDITACKNISDLKKLNIFEDDQYNKEIWEAIKPKGSKQPDKAFEIE